MRSRRNADPNPVVLTTTEVVDSWFGNRLLRQALRLSPFSPHLAAQLISAISSEKWIEMYEQSRLMTRAGKQGAPSASKLAVKRVATKRRR